VVACRVRRLIFALLIAAALPCADAEAASPEERKRARSLAEEGAKLFERGDFSAALVRFEEAEALVPVVTITLERARTLEKLGRWVEALEVLQSIGETPLAPSSHPSHKKARAEAVELAAALDLRTPRLALDVRPARDGTLVLLDGEPMAPEITQGVAVRIDPGAHLLEARATDGASAKRELELLPGDRREIRLLLELPRPKPLDEPEASTGSTQRTAGWISLGVGGALFATGAALGLGAVVMRGDLAEQCPGDVCPELARGRCRDL
jgi:tetratricopeptide (TPR) repeat protein